MALAFTTLSNAQQKPSKKTVNPEARASRTVNLIADSIEVTESQKEELRVVFMDFFTMVHAIQEKDSVTQEDHKVMIEAKRQRDERVKSILNDDKKYEKYQKIISEKKAERRNKRGDKKGKKGAFVSPENASELATKQVKKISETISLTSVQQDSLRNIFSERNIARAQFKQNPNKNEADKAGFKATMKNFETRIEKVMASPEKYEQYKKMRKEKIAKVRERRNQINKTEEEPTQD